MSATEQARKCKTCGEVQPLSNFPRYFTGSGGHRHSCKPCAKAKRLQSLEANPERAAKIRARELAYNEANRARKAEAARLWREQNPERNRAMLARYREENHDKVKARLRGAYARRQKWAINLLGGKCAECGTTDRLEFDHIDPTTKSFVISRRLLAPIEELRAELTKCQLLCNSCHIEKSRTDIIASRRRLRAQRQGISA